MKIQKILIGIAFSPNLKPNIYEAIRLANMFNAALVGVHVGKKDPQKEQQLLAIFHEIFHYYFNGCLITRIERKLWKDYPKWYGPKSSLGFIIVEKMGYEMNSELANNIFFGIMILSPAIAIIKATLQANPSIHTVL